MPPSIPRGEYPRPQFVRRDWLCLNGQWEFEIDAGDSGLERGLLERPLKDRIVVPFCPESTLSGIGNTDFMNAVWYRRQVTLPAAWQGKRVLLHLGASDYDTTVWVARQGRPAVEVGRHRGGFTSFSFDLRGAAAAGETIAVIVRARDDNRTLAQPMGKQSFRYGNFSCLYTRTTGIWQTVWLEPAPQIALARPRITPDVAGGCFHVTLPLDVAQPPSPGDANFPPSVQSRRGWTARAALRDASGAVAGATVPADADFSPQLTLAVPAQRHRLWSPQDPHLYDLDIELLDAAGNVVDSAQSYAGLRSVAIDGRAVLLNGKPLFQRLVLDQGFYRDGILTAPTDDALKRDIELAQAAGFNGARLHQKVFEERFLYHADRMGYICWGEFADWGCNVFGPPGENQQPTTAHVTQWLESITRDYNHPSIVGWCGLNECNQDITDKITQLDDVQRAMFLAAKALDPTRPVLDTSGYAHRVAESDVQDCHNYEQDVTKFRADRGGLATILKNAHDPKLRTWDIAYRGQPFMNSEFGGIWWNPADAENLEAWGYGDRPKTIEEFYKRFEGLCSSLLDDPDMFGYCYTQLTDVFQEVNGIYTFDRQAKFDLNRLRAIQSRAAAIERK